MTIKILNTLTKNKEEFKPIKKGVVSIYHCGPTVYWNQHIGNMRAMFVSDIVRRTFEFFDYKVKFVRNYTDVGHLLGDNSGDADSGQDRMEKASLREGVSPERIAQKYIDVFDRDLELLNIEKPTKAPRATQHIKEMIEMIQKLINNGFAYATDLAIYFDVSKAINYNRLSGQDLSKNLSGSGKGEILDKKKRNPNDFALWFFKAGVHEKALQTWESPFSSSLVKNGQGFPGWHIECSAMSKKYLGDTFDIHIGGIEHIPVHHTNEIAQSESANGKPYVNYWIHNEHLVSNSEKISKSAGGGILLSTIIEKGFSPFDLRFFFLQSHYRSKQNFTWEALEGAKKGLNNLYKQFNNLGKKKGKTDKSFLEKFEGFIGDDFNTPQALALVSEVLKSDISDPDKKATLLSFDKVFGLDLEKENKRIFNIKIPKEIKELAQLREEKRKAKDFEGADNLRKKLEDKGFLIKDIPDGFEIIKK